MRTECRATAPNEADVPPALGNGIRVFNKSKNGFGNSASIGWKGTLLFWCGCPVQNVCKSLLCLSLTTRTPNPIKIPFVKITLLDGEVQVINTDHIIRVLKMGDKVELEMVGGFGIRNFPPQRYAELMIELGVASKPVRISSYVRDEPVL